MQETVWANSDAKCLQAALQAV